MKNKDRFPVQGKVPWPEDMLPEDIVSRPPWLHLLSPMWRAWREKQIVKGRNPDPYILSQLKKAKRWKEDS